MALFQNKYRVESTRFPWWDYSWPGFYFVTICTTNRIYEFGSIDHGWMQLSPAGQIIDEYWRAIPKLRANVELDIYVVMPNHFHGILRILEPAGMLNENPGNKNKMDDGKNSYINGAGLIGWCQDRWGIVETPRWGVSTKTTKTTAVSRIPPGTSRPRGGTNPQWKSGVLGAIIGQFKAATTKKIRQSINHEFQWQPWFHDRIIRDEN
ncbi:MAG: hypothetical protein V1913_08950, partial [Fibrobacterota bacterium]